MPGARSTAFKPSARDDKARVCCVQEYILHTNKSEIVFLNNNNTTNIIDLNIKNAININVKLYVATQYTLLALLRTRSVHFGRVIKPRALAR